MGEKEKEICEDYGFLFCDNVENPAVHLTAIGWQIRNSREGEAFFQQMRAQGYLSVKV